MTTRNTTTLVAALGLAALLVPSIAQAGDAEAGKNTYTMFCVTCHGESGKGDGPVGMALQPPPRDFTSGDFKFDADGDGKPGTDADLKAVITEGAGKFGGSELMAPWSSLAESDIDNLIAHIHSLKQ